MNLNINFPKIIHFSISLSHKAVISKNNIAEKIFAVNPTNSIIFLGKDTVKPTKADMKKAAEILTDNPEYALSQGLVNNLSTMNTLAHEMLSFKQHNSETIKYQKNLLEGLYLVKFCS